MPSVKLAKILIINDKYIIMVCKLSHGSVKIYTGTSTGCDINEKDNEAEIASVPIMYIADTSATHPSLGNISIKSVLTKPPNATSNVFILESGKYGASRAMEYGLEFNKIKSIAIPPKTKCSINYDLVDPYDDNCIRQRGDNDNGFVFSKSNPATINVGILGFTKAYDNTQCEFITCNDIIDLGLKVSGFVGKPNMVPFINYITVESDDVEHFTTNNESMQYLDNETIFIMAAIIIMVCLVLYNKYK